MYKYNIKKQSHDYKYRKEFDSTSIWLWKSPPQRPRPLQYGRGIEKEINIVLKSSIYNHSLLQKGVKQHNNKDLRRRVWKNKLRNTQTIFSLNDLNIWNPDSAVRWKQPFLLLQLEHHGSCWSQVFISGRARGATAWSGTKNRRGGNSLNLHLLSKLDRMARRIVHVTIIISLKRWTEDCEKGFLTW